jgi:hypothetical protein
MPCRVVILPIVGILAVFTWGSLAKPAAAQSARGFSTVAPAVSSGLERQRQPDLYVFEVQFKPLRMIFVDVTDPQTGEVERQQVWYLAYRAVNRSFETRADDTDTTPVNVLDPLPGPSQFIPEFTLITHDQPDSDLPVHEHLGEVVPEVTAAINQVERRRPSDPLFLDSVSIVQPVPGTFPPEESNVDWIYGVAMWRNVDPDTDFFRVVIRGFSNAYERRPGPDGETVTWRKSLVQRFIRRGDRYDPNQIEFEHNGPPEWVYLPDPVEQTSQPAVE